MKTKDVTKTAGGFFTKVRDFTEKNEAFCNVSLSVVLTGVMVSCFRKLVKIAESWD